MSLTFKKQKGSPVYTLNTPHTRLRPRTFTDVALFLAITILAICCSRRVESARLRLSTSPSHTSRSSSNRSLSG